MNRIVAFALTALFSLSCYSLTAHKPVILHDIYGASFPFSSLNGKWVFINYWASWCHPCRNEIPELNRFYNINKKDTVALFAVNYDGLPNEKQTKLARQFGIQYPSLSQDPALDLDLGEIQVLPVTFVFNPKGQLNDVLYGAQTMEGLNAYLQKNTQQALDSQQWIS